MKRIHIVAATLAALATISGGTFYLRSSSAEAKTAAAQPQATPVPVAVIERHEVTTWDEFSGRLEAVERVDVRSRVAGAVQSVHFSEGALVKRGDLLVTIDPAPYAAEVDRAQAQVAAAQARLTYAKSEHERVAAAVGRKRDRAARARRARRTRAQEAEANVRAARGRAAVGALEPRLHAGARAGLRPRRQARGHRRQPGRRRAGRSGADHARLGEPDLRQLRCRRAGGRARAAEDAARHRKPQLRASPWRWARRSTTRRRRGRPAARRQPGEREERHGARARGLRQQGRQPDARPVRASCAWAAPKTTPAVLINERAVGTDQSKKFVMVVGADNKAAYREVTLGGSGERAAHRDLGARGGRAHRRERPAARAARRAGRSAAADDGAGRETRQGRRAECAEART